MNSLALLALLGPLPAALPTDNPSLTVEVTGTLDDATGFVRVMEGTEGTFDPNARLLRVDRFLDYDGAPLTFEEIPSGDYVVVFSYAAGNSKTAAWTFVTLKEESASVTLEVPALDFSKLLALEVTDSEGEPVTSDLTFHREGKGDFLTGGRTRPLGRRGGTWYFEVDSGWAIEGLPELRLTEVYIDVMPRNAQPVRLYIEEGQRTAAVKLPKTRTVMLEIEGARSYDRVALFLAPLDDLHPDPDLPLIEVQVEGASTQVALLPSHDYLVKLAGKDNGGSGLLFAGIFDEEVILTDEPSLRLTVPELHDFDLELPNGVVDSLVVRRLSKKDAIGLPKLLGEPQAWRAAALVPENRTLRCDGFPAGIWTLIYQSETKKRNRAGLRVPKGGVPGGKLVIE